MTDCITIENLSFSYTKDPVLHNLNLSVKEGELLAIIGENGSGKSTLLKLMIGALKKHDGTINILGKELSHMRDFSDIGYVHQNLSVHGVAFPITCLEMVTLNLYRSFGPFKIPNRRVRQKAIEMLREMSLDEYTYTPFKELSGGLQQRVMICRALMNDPKILIMDEPTAGIDKESKGHFLRLIRTLNEKFAVTVILVTHELELIREYLPEARVLKMSEGELQNV